MKKRVTNTLNRIQRITAGFLCLVLFLTVLCPLTAFAAETEQKTVRVGYVNVATYEEGGEGEYKRGYGYEYLQKLSYITGWRYEYVYGSFKECYEKLVNGEIDLFGNVSYKPERAESVFFSTYPQGKDTYLLYTTRKNSQLTTGNIDNLNNCKIGVTEGSYQEGLLKDWLKSNEIQAQTLKYDGYDTLMAALDKGELDAMVTPDLATSYDYQPIVNIGFSDYYFAVSKSRPDLLKELNAALYEIQNSESDYNNLLVSKYQQNLSKHLLLTDKEKGWLISHDNKLKIGYLAENLPYSTQSEDGEMGGVMKALADTLEKEFGISVETKCYETSKQYKEALNRGEVDIIGPWYSDFYLAEQEDYVLTNSFISTAPVILYKNFNLNTSYRKIAVTNESLFSEDVVRVLYPEAELYLCDGIEECLNAVVSGKADSTLVTSMRLNVLRQYPAMDKLQFADTQVKSEICLATTKANRVAAGILNKGIALSSDCLNGVALAENSYVKKTVTFGDFVNEHTLAVFGAVVLIILIQVLLLYRMKSNEKKLTAALEEARKEKEYSNMLNLYNRELESEANNDSLTNIGNRNFFFPKLSGLLEEKEQLAICYCDLDNLKYINDNYGHSEGDCYIRHFVDIVKNHIRADDIFARIGGDEFCITLRRCGKETAEEKIQHMQKLFAGDNTKEYPKNFSCGIIEVPENHDGIDVMELLKQADALMYEQKKEHKKMFR